MRRDFQPCLPQAAERLLVLFAAMAAVYGFLQFLVRGLHAYFHSCGAVAQHFVDVSVVAIIGTRLYRKPYDAVLCSFVQCLGVFERLRIFSVESVKGALYEILPVQLVPCHESSAHYYQLALVSDMPYAVELLEPIQDLLEGIIFIALGS